ncbi:hypothetical protein TNCT_612241 [Trichonephila clavata]|uniref:Uncharacterized protein n=1 Tax=Trichonephila clavata TaxID=2740835 RepID=A0A8X6IIE7_TRICU|nr:hypothetical protein TNCT_612241 [Trichonephila clavata]
MPCLGRRRRETIGASRDKSSLRDLTHSIISSNKDSCLFRNNYWTSCESELVIPVPFTRIVFYIGTCAGSSMVPTQATWNASNLRSSIIKAASLGEQMIPFTNSEIIW